MRSKTPAAAAPAAVGLLAEDLGLLLLLGMLVNELR
jgi:hypothetical protein